MRSSWLPAALFAAIAPLPAQAATCRLEGRVVDARSDPVVAATLTAECDGVVVARTQCDAAGVFVFGRLPQDRVIVRATTATPDVGALWVDLLGESRWFARVRMMPARAVTGVVRDLAGQPVAGAWVVTGPYDAGDLSWCTESTTSDAEGRYRLAHVPFGRNVLRAWAPDCDAFEGTVDGTGDVELECNVDRDAVQERVFKLAGANDAQRAAARLEVRALHAGCPLPLPEALRLPALEADGAWHVRGWPYTDETRACVRGIATDPKQVAVPSNVGRWQCEFAVNEDPAAHIKGQLEGEGVCAGWTVVAQSCEDSWPPERTIGRTNADGSFDLAAPIAVECKFALRVVAASYVVRSDGSASRGWYVARHEAGRVHTVPIVPAHSLTLHVASPTGEPVVGASIVVHGNAGRPDARAQGGLNFSRCVPLAEGVTDAAGATTIGGLELQGGENILCSVQAAEGTLMQVFQTETGNRTRQDFALAPGATLSLLVMDDQGRPLPGARVGVTAYTSAGGREVHAAADRSGVVFVRGLPACTYGFRLLDERAVQQRQLPADEVTTVELRRAPR